MALQTINLTEHGLGCDAEIVVSESGNRLTVCIYVTGVCVARVGMPKPGTALIVGRVWAELAGWPEDITDGCKHLT